MALANAIVPDEARGQLEAWLAKRLDGATDVRVEDVRVPSSSGMSAETVMFSATWEQAGEQVARRLVARVAPSGEGLFMDYHLEMEFEVLRALGSTPVPVPEVLFAEPDPAVLGSPFFVMEAIDGQTASDDPPFTVGGWVVELPSEQQAQLAENAIAALVELHAQDIGVLGLSDIGHGDPELRGLDRLIAYWRTVCDWALDEPNPLIFEALRWLEDNEPASTAPDVLCWGDSRLGNMIVGDDLSINALVDWEMVATGPREVDLGWWLFLLAHHTVGIGAPLPPGFPTREQEIARYEELSGHTVRDIQYFEVLGGVRMAILVARAAHLMKAAGLIPADSAMALVNPATALLAGLLDLPAPTGDSDYYIGNR